MLIKIYPPSKIKTLFLLLSFIFIIFILLQLVRNFNNRKNQNNKVIFTPSAVPKLSITSKPKNDIYQLCAVERCVEWDEESKYWVIKGFYDGKPILEPRDIKTKEGKILAQSIYTLSLFVLKQDGQLGRIYFPWLIKFPDGKIWDINGDKYADQEFINYLLEGGLAKEGYVKGVGINLIISDNLQKDVQNRTYLESNAPEYLSKWDEFHLSWQKEISQFIKSQELETMEMVWPLKAPKSLLKVDELPL